MPRSFVWLALLLIACLPCSVRADDDADSAPLPPAAKRVLEDAEKAVAKNRRTFEAANDASLDEAEKALKAVMDSLTKDGKLEEALATKKLLATFREQVAGTADGSSKPKPTDASKRKPVAKTPARGGKPQFNEQFGFTDEKRVAEFWGLDEKAKNHQLGTEGIRLDEGGTMTLRPGLIGDYEIAIRVKQSFWGKIAVLRVSGLKIDIGEDEDDYPYDLMVVRKGNQVFVTRNGKQSVLTVPENELEKPQHPSITGVGRTDVRGVAIKAMKVERPEE